MEKKIFSLTQGRHKMIDTEGNIIQKSIFGKNLLMNIEGLEDYSKEFIKQNGSGQYEIFVTGFTPALTSFIKVAHQGQEVHHLILWHYDSVADTYRKQIMW